MRLVPDSAAEQGWGPWGTLLGALLGVIRTDPGGPCWVPDTNLST